MQSCMFVGLFVAAKEGRALLHVRGLVCGCQPTDKEKEEERALLHARGLVRGCRGSL